MVEALKNLYLGLDRIGRKTMCKNFMIVFLVFLMAAPYSYGITKVGINNTPEKPTNAIGEILTYLIFTRREERKQGKKLFENWVDVLSFVCVWLTLSTLTLAGYVLAFY